MKNRESEFVDQAYRTLRRVVGIIGVALPVVLAVGSLIFDSPSRLQDSISAYYGTTMRNILVGALFTIGWFLFSYHGYDRRDDAAGYLACAFALGVALFPTTSPLGWVRTVHILSALALFLVLAYFSAILFTKTRPGKTPGRRKLQRNSVYRVCGWFMVGCIVLIAVYKAFLAGTAVSAIKPVFWLESLALWAFGISWFVKGETLLKDGA